MNVELEDGTVVTDVPEGTTKSQLLAKVNKYRQPEQPSLMRRITDVAAGLSPMHIEKAQSAGEGFVTGLGDTIYKAGQLMENVPGVTAAREGVGKMLGVKPNSMREIVKQREADYQAEREKAGRSGVDVARLAGNIANPINIAAGVAGGIPNTLRTAITTGGKVGAFTGAMQPVTGEGNLAVETGKQTLEGGAGGALVGGGIYGGAKTVGAARDIASDVSDYFSKEGYKNLARKHIVKNIGEAHVPEVRSALLNAQPTLPARAPVTGAEGPTLPASPVTAAEAVKDISAGSPVQAMQKITYETPGGPSKIGGDIQREALAAQKAAKASRDAELIPRMNEILQRADRAGQVVPKLEKVASAGERASKVTMPKEVPTDTLKSATELHAPYAPPLVPSTKDMAREQLMEAVKTRGQQAKQAMEMLKQEGMQPLRVGTITGRISKTLNQEGIRASDTTEKTLGWIRDKLKENADLKGNISGQDLWMIRKEARNVIDKFSGEDKNFDKRLTSKLLIGIQQDIDDAIEAAGGKGWKDAMKDYSTRSRMIEGDIEAKESLYKPLQRTSVVRGAQIADASLPGGGGPPLLRTGYTVAKWIPKVRAEIIEPKVDAYMADLFRNAPNLGKALADQPVSKRNAIVQALMQQAPGVTGMMAGRR
jgi:hypothetical protein